MRNIILPLTVILFIFISCIQSNDKEKKENTTNDSHKEKKIKTKPKKKKIIYSENKIYACFPEEDKEIKLSKKLIQLGY